MLHASIRQTKLRELRRSAGDRSPGEQGQLRRSQMDPAARTAASLPSSWAASRARSHAGSAVQPSKSEHGPSSAQPWAHDGMAQCSASPMLQGRDVPMVPPALPWAGILQLPMLPWLPSSSSSSSGLPASSHSGSPRSLHPSPNPRTMLLTKYFASEGSPGEQALHP